MTLFDYIDRARPEIRQLCLEHLDEFKRGVKSHPGKQKGKDGLSLHTCQVIGKALELNQVFDEQEIIETCLVHDLTCWEKFPLKAHQVTAILATKGLPWKAWRHRDKHAFTALILIADMWSAYINENDEEEEDHAIAGGGVVCGFDSKGHIAYVRGKENR